MAEIRSNDDSSRLGLYAGILGTGFAAGAAFAVRNDPMYDDLKRARGQKVPKRNQPWRKEYMPHVMDSTEYGLYDLAQRKGDYSTALKMERKAEKAFLRMSEDEQMAVINNFRKLSGESGSFISRMFRRAPKKL